MIDVLKRLAQLDSVNPNVEKVKMTNEQSLATMSNINGEKIDECGSAMNMMGSQAATFSINASAPSGDEVANMLTKIMTLAGVKSPSQEPDSMSHHEIELEPAHSAELGSDDIGRAIDIVDKMDGNVDDYDDDLPMDGPEKESPVADMADEVRGMADALADKREEGIVGAGLGGMAGGAAGEIAGGALGTALGGPIGGALGAVAGDIAGTALGAEAGDKLTGNDDDKTESYANNPNPQVAHHRYGDDQVKPKEQGLKQRFGDNPYEQTTEAVAARLMKQWQQYVSEASNKCCCQEKGKSKCPVHSKKKVLKKK